MNDIVERLRRKVFHGPTMEAVHTKTLEWQAADEIDRLRAQNAELVAAGKSLLAAAIEVGELPPDYGPTKRMRAAIAKHEGESND